MFASLGIFPYRYAQRMQGIFRFSGYLFLRVINQFDESNSRLHIQSKFQCVYGIYLRFRRFFGVCKYLIERFPYFLVLENQGRLCSQLGFGIGLSIKNAE